MSRPILKIGWNALAVVGLVLVVWLVITGGGIGNGPPTPTPTPTRGHGPVILEAIRHVNKQVFIEHYSMVDVSYSKVPPGWISFLGTLGIKQEFVILLRGRVPAGFDLEQVTLDDIWVSSDGRRVQLTLPSPVVFKDNVSLDFENSRIIAQHNACPSFICEGTAIEAYQNEILPYGRDVLIEYALKTGILDQVARDGQAYYQQLLSSLGFDEVRVVVTGYGL